MASSADILRARALRRSASPPEVRLWGFLRTLRREGHHFRRQAPFRGYFLDFVCYGDRLVIEADGAQHGTEEQLARDAVLAREGFRTLRFLAVDVMGNLEGVSVAIREALGVLGPSSAPCPTPTLPKQGREKK